MSKVQTHETICKELNALYARKNADYGDSFGKSYKEYGLTMACIRLEDKLNRIKALRTKEAQVSDESILDTLMDLANYSIMTVIEMRGEDSNVHTKEPCYEPIDEACLTCYFYTPDAPCVIECGVKGVDKHPDLPRVGSHFNICSGDCRCNTCRRDNTSVDDGSVNCCDTHYRRCVDTKPCPDYVPDCEEANNEA